MTIASARHGPLAQLGRAPALQAGGRGFDLPMVHQIVGSIASTKLHVTKSERKT